MKGTAKSLKDLGKQSRSARMEDLYQIGFAFVELIISCFSDDTSGATRARAIVGGRSEKMEMLFNTNSERRSQLSMQEIQNIFENHCDSDFKEFRDFIGYIKEWSDAIAFLEANSGLAWKFILRLLARGRLTDPTTGEKIKVTCTTLLKENAEFFLDLEAEVT